MYRILGGLAIGTVVAVGVWCWRAPAAAPVNLPAPRALPQYLGVSSCAAASCHQRPGPGVQGCEYSIWIDADPHARAYQTLHEARSEQIVRNLGGSAAAPAWKNALCLGCHATSPPEEQRAPTFSLRDGVGCESCHGPAGGWLTQHYLPGWKERSAAEKAACGMVPTKNLVARTEQCVRCHVGTGEFEVNHDLIAAGHPRLTFEAGGFLARYPRHWSARAEKQRLPDFEARAWAVGQAVTAQAALELLANRAADQARPWPEFAEYDCLACHRALPQRPRDFGGRLPGLLPWGTWHFALLEPRPAQELLGVDTGAASPLGRLRQSMSGMNVDRQQVAAEARAAAAALDAALPRLAERSLDAAQARALLQALAEPEPLGRDQAAQRYLALAAFHHALTDLDPRQRDPKLRQAIEALLSPLSAAPFDAALFQKRLEAVRHYQSPPR